MRRQQSIEPEDGADARQLLLRVEPGQIVVSSAGADAADRRQASRNVSKIGAGVIVEPAGDRHVELAAARRARRPRAAAASNSASRAMPFSPAFTAGHQRFELPQDLVVACRRSRPARAPRGACSAVAPAVAAISSATFLRADLVQLVERAAGSPPICSASPSRSSSPLSTIRLLTWIVNASKPIAAQQIVDHQHRFDVGHRRERADRVEIALHELAIAAALRVLAAPHRRDVVALERRARVRSRCWATNRANGTVRSNRMATSRSP